MATIIKKIKKGRPYYYAVQSKRVGGKPRIVWQKYLGTVEAIVQRVKQAQPSRPRETIVFEAGGVAALLRIAKQLGLLELIDDIVKKRAQGPSVGHYMLLAVINRALAPCSKLAIGDWYEETILRRLWRFPKSAFSSQRFWDHMEMVSNTAIETIQKRVLPRIRASFGIDPRVLLYDTTNFFTFIATSNDRAKFPQRGHSKAKRHDLRQVGLALLVTRQFQIPLFHCIYPGHIPDVSLFTNLSRDLINRYQETAGECQEATLVFDKGNVSDDAMEQLVVSGTHFVAALSANRLPDLLVTSLERFEDVPGLSGTQAFATNVTVWGKACRAVVAYTESFFTQQLSGITNNLVKCQKKLLELEKSLHKWRQGKGGGRRPTIGKVQNTVREILSAQFMRGLFHIKVEEEQGLPRLHYRVDQAAFRKLSSERLGRTLLVTDHPDWTPKQVIEAYRSLTAIEESFKHMKNVNFLHWQPAYHWTDQKLRVHAFYCVLALLLTTLARKAVVQAGIDLSIPALLKEICAIREVAVIYPQGTLAHRKDHITLSRMSSRQKKLAEILRIGEILQDG